MIGCGPPGDRTLNPQIKRTLEYVPEHVRPNPRMPERAGQGNFRCQRVPGTAGQVRNARTRNEPTAPIVSSDTDDHMRHPW